MKRTYHTDISIRYKLGILDDKVVKDIPRTTLHNWKNRDFSKLFCFDNIYDNDENINLIREFLTRKKLLEAAKILYFVYSTLSMILSNLRNKKRVLFEAKDEIVKTIDLAKNVVGIKKACRIFQITYSKYNSWKNKCKNSVIGLCRKVNLMQLAFAEVETVKKYCINKSLLNWSLSSVYYKMIRDKAAYMSLNCFYKYAKLLNLSRIYPKNRRKKHSIGIRAEKAKEILHADLTIFRPMNNVKVYIYVLADNFSRYILSITASLEYSAKIAFQNLKSGFEKYNLINIDKKVDLIVDDGSENKAEVDRYIENVNIRKLIAQKDILFSNSMVEAVNKSIKYDFLFHKELLDFEQTKSYLQTVVEEYNNKPYHPLKGLTPKEVFEGKLPDKNMFKKEIVEAKRQRIEENRKNLCQNHNI